ncbi:MAG: 3-dehydroquinate synthase, partial [Peptoniphilus grossensis]
MKIQVKENNYTIDIDYKSDEKLRDYLFKNEDAKFLVITDENVLGIYSERLKNIMDGLNYFIYKFPAG